MTFRNTKIVNRIYDTVYFLLTLACIYIPSSLNPLRWVILACLIGSTPIFVYMHKSYSGVHKIIECVLYLLVCAMLGTIILNQNIPWFNESTLSTVIFFMIIVNSGIHIYQEKQEKINRHKAAGAMLIVASHPLLIFYRFLLIDYFANPAKSKLQ